MAKVLGRINLTAMRQQLKSQRATTIADTNLALSAAHSIALPFGRQIEIVKRGLSQARSIDKKLVASGDKSR